MYSVSIMIKWINQTNYHTLKNVFSFVILSVLKSTVTTLNFQVFCWFWLLTVFTVRLIKFLSPVCFSVRANMTEFWKEHSRGATVEEMMLDSRAQELTQNELPEILSMLPSLVGSTILELGAGIG